ncbi:hypothetical protein LC612_42225 [Nostoc sp. CHAB 5834]|nr:hypothetical protein [Nostoc sp. CHAB 5834]
MRRIAYLSKRGNIWWFRRRHPAIVIQPPQNPQVSGVCGYVEPKTQAKGHLAVSLQTSSSREARLIGARLSAHFEVAWSVLETGAGSMDDQSDPLENMALMLTDGFRKYVSQYRATGVAGMAPALRERAFAVLDADLRQALGIAPLPYADLLTRVEIRPAIKYIALHAPDHDSPLTEEDAFHERMALEATKEAGRDWEAEEDASSVPAIDADTNPAFDTGADSDQQRLAAMAAGLANVLEEYFAVCAQGGLDPRNDTPSARKMADRLHHAAIQLGFPESSGRAEGNQQTRSVYSKVPFTDFAAQYLNLRRKGYVLRLDEEEESPHEPTGSAFKRTSLGN